MSLVSINNFNSFFKGSLKEQAVFTLQEHRTTIDSLTYQYDLVSINITGVIVTPPPATSVTFVVTSADKLVRINGLSDTTFYTINIVTRANNYNVTGTTLDPTINAGKPYFTVNGDSATTVDNNVSYNVTDGTSYTVYTFKNTGINFTIDISNIALFNGVMNILAVGGGGTSVNTGSMSGGGGGGGVVARSIVLYKNNFNKETITINVGDGGGPSSTNVDNNNGVNTTVNFLYNTNYNITACGGGGGGLPVTASFVNTQSGKNGGSGGGAGSHFGYRSTGGLGNRVPGTTITPSSTIQGNSGGETNGLSKAGGGGGAENAGTNGAGDGTSATGGHGGNGINCTLPGINPNNYYGGGGGGGTFSGVGSNGGLGGGGAGNQGGIASGLSTGLGGKGGTNSYTNLDGSGSNTSTGTGMSSGPGNGAPNTGGGGGGSTSNRSAKGGSGVVVISILNVIDTNPLNYNNDNVFTTGNSITPFNLNGLNIIRFNENNSIKFSIHTIADILIVGGGGAGGGTANQGVRCSAGGGGAGSVGIGKFVFLANQLYNINIGSGGTVTSNLINSNGENTIISNNSSETIFQAFGGGKGANTATLSSSNGGSGGGGIYITAVVSGGNVISNSYKGIKFYGNRGGTGTATAAYQRGAGGGGALSSGENSGGYGGGGVGISWEILPTEVFGKGGLGGPITSTNGLNGTPQNSGNGGQGGGSNSITVGGRGANGCFIIAF